MQSKQYAYAYPRPMVTVDVAVLSGDAVVLIQRKYAPFEGQWALPGGFVDMDEGLEAAAARELQEETGLEGLALRQFRTYGEPGRDPRGRSISVVYVAHAGENMPEPRGGDDAAEARWFPLDGLPPLAFDHARILGDLGAWQKGLSGV